MAAKAELDLREALLTTGLIVPVKVESQGGRLSALCREVPQQAAKWMEVMNNILSRSVGTDLSFHLCRQYVWKDERMVFGWHVGIEAKGVKDLQRHVDFLKEVLGEATPELVPAEVKPSTSVVGQPAAQESEEDIEEEQETVLSPAQMKNLEARREEYRKHTTAAPRPQADDRVIAVPSNYPAMAAPRVIYRGKAKDTRGRIVPVIVEEAPLPYVFTDDMNVPNDKGRGAKTLG
jgi:hypothetical protein